MLKFFMLRKLRLLVALAMIIIVFFGWQVCKVFYEAIHTSDAGLVLIGAAEDGDKKEVKSLLSSGIDPNYKSTTGNTPLKAAKRGRHTEVINLLKAAGAKEE